MNRPRPEKKREPAPSASRILPMHLKTGNRQVDETGEREVASHPCISNAGKNASVRVKKVNQPEVRVVVTERRRRQRCGAPARAGAASPRRAACPPAAPRARDRPRAAERGETQDATTVSWRLDRAVEIGPVGHDRD